MAYTSSFEEQTEAKVDRSAVESAEWAMTSATELAGRVEDVVMRLCGSSPMNAASGNVEKLSGPGILPNLKEKSEKTVDQIRRAMGALDRLDRSI